MAKRKKTRYEKLKEKAWNLCSKYIRLKYSDKKGYVSCVTCGKTAFWSGEGMQAGHLLDGRCNSILFEEKIIFPQCTSCNMFRSGNKEKYIPWFIDKFGRELFDEMVQQKNKVLKFTEEDLEEKIEYFKEKIEELQDE